jgi:hypothetical protein
MLSWWNPGTRWKPRLIQSAIILAAALISSALTFIVTTNYAGFIWFERGVLFPVLNIAVAVTTILSLGFYLHRTLRRNEV